MSRGAGPALGPKLSRAIALAAPLSAALALTFLAVGAVDAVDQELLFVAPELAQAGSPVPVRAQLLLGLRRTEGPHLGAAPCSVELLDRAGVRVASTELRAGLGPTLEGAVSVPKGTSGTLTLRAIARAENATVIAQRPIDVRAQLPAAPQPEPRRVQPLQRLSAGPLRTHGTEEPPLLEARIRGGACVPELPCTLLVYVGPEPVSVHVLSSPSVTPAPADAQPTTHPRRIAALTVTTHGPEATLELIATRNAELVATRRVRLEIALGSATAGGPVSFVERGTRPAVGLLGEQGACIIDAFVADHFVASATAPLCEADSALPFVLDTIGPVRLQLRRDPFGSDSAAVRNVHVRAEGASDRDALSTLAQRALQRDPVDPLALAVQAAPDAFSAEADLAAAYLLAILDEGVLPMPAAVSSLPLAQQRLAAAKARARKLAMLVFALCALSLAALLADRGLASGSVAEALLADAGSDRKTLARMHSRTLLRVIAAVGSILLIFATVAAYVVARGHGLDGP